MNLFKKDREQQIVDMFDNGDAKAMNSLYAEYAAKLTGVCSRYISDSDVLKDVLQESFIKIFTHIHSFEYRGTGSLEAWLKRIVVNESLLYLRQQNAVPTTSLEDEKIELKEEEEPDVVHLSGMEIRNFIQQLPAGYRAVFNLYAIEGKSHKEIAELLQIKPDTSASQYHRAKTMLANMINAYKQKEAEK